MPKIHTHTLGLTADSHSCRLTFALQSWFIRHAARTTEEPATLLRTESLTEDLERTFGFPRCACPRLVQEASSGAPPHSESMHCCDRCATGLVKNTRVPNITFTRATYERLLDEPLGNTTARKLLCNMYAQDIACLFGDHYAQHARCMAGVSLPSTL